MYSTIFETKITGAWYTAGHAEITIGDKFGNFATVSSNHYGIMILSYDKNNSLKVEAVLRSLELCNLLGDREINDTLTNSCLKINVSPRLHDLIRNYAKLYKPCIPKSKSLHCIPKFP